MHSARYRKENRDCCFVLWIRLSRGNGNCGKLPLYFLKPGKVSESLRLFGGQYAANGSGWRKEQLLSFRPSLSPAAARTRGLEKHA
jgi:hypothetical protein